MAGLWSMLLGPLVIGLLIYFGWQRLSVHGATLNDILQWGIIIGIFTPISLGLIIFGRYAYTGAYNEME